MSRLLRNTLRLTVLLVTAGVFCSYLMRHPALFHLVLRTAPSLIALLLLLYLAWFGAMTLTLHATLRLCRRTLPPVENILLNAYSTLVNFFVPGQGGVAVRGLYLHRKHQLGMRHYVLATLLYYVSYAIVSALMLLATSRPWWQTLTGLVVVCGASAYVLRRYAERSQMRSTGLALNAANIAFLLFATVVQAVIQVTVYYAELHAVDARASLWQTVTYAGAANFSLFAALTPGAIGIRESFLFFSRPLHHVSTETIVAASMIDRAVFLILLGLLFLLTLAFHARKTLQFE